MFDQCDWKTGMWSECNVLSSKGKEYPLLPYLDPTLQHLQALMGHTWSDNKLNWTDKYVNNKTVFWCGDYISQLGLEAHWDHSTLRRVALL